MADVQHRPDTQDGDGPRLADDGLPPRSVARNRRRCSARYGPIAGVAYRHFRCARWLDSPACNVALQQGVGPTHSEPVSNLAPDGVAMVAIHYAKSGELNIAYRVVGDGAGDLVYVSGWVTNVEVMQEDPGMARFLRRLASF